MANLIVSPLARKDLVDIYEYFIFEQDNPTYAKVLRKKLLEKFIWLKTYPNVGNWNTQSDPQKRFRFWTVDHYQIVYREQKDGVEIVRVIHDARNIKGLLSKDIQPPEIS